MKDIMDLRAINANLKSKTFDFEILSFSSSTQASIGVY
jgi:hypothetical protein